MQDERCPTCGSSGITARQQMYVTFKDSDICNEACIEWIVEHLNQEFIRKMRPPESDEQSEI
jgi:hypothetical protein